jgi:hypothetical protein
MPVGSEAGALGEAEMALRLVQLSGRDGVRRVAATEGGEAWVLDGVRSTLDLARQAIAGSTTLSALVAVLPKGESVDLGTALSEGRILAPIDHPDPAHVAVTGTGLTHLGSAEGRNKMHQSLQDTASLTDSMKMFKLGLEGGRPSPGCAGVQPEWFYKGDGSIIAPPEGALSGPEFGLDGGEEPEIAGVYVIGDDGAPYRLGYALGNEFSDHVTERENYLYLAHSKLRPCSLGPELLVGPLPQEIDGVSRIRRGDEIIWSQPFLSGEAHMCHSLANLEHHHFKYGLFRRAGDVHVHFFGTSTLSFSDGVRTQPGDVFEIEAPPFQLPLRNTFRIEPTAAVTHVREL